MNRVRLTGEEAEALVIRALTKSGAVEANARSVAKALVAAEIDGQKGHGLARVPAYCAQVASGKVNGNALPRIERLSDSALRVDAANGFAFPAIDLAISELKAKVHESGIAIALIHRSHHFGQAGYHVERLAQEQLIGLVFGNSPKAIAPWGGSQPLFGTNPIAFAAPRLEHEPLVIDLSLSKVARGKVMRAAQQDEPIPEGWALDADGRPTTDANAALAGTMLPMGDAKGAALVMMVEILAAALTGANYGFEASSFFEAEGEPPGVGQCLFALDPQRLSGGGFAQRLEVLIEAILGQEGTRLPGERRLVARSDAEKNGVHIPEPLHAQLLTLI